MKGTVHYDNKWTKYFLSIFFLMYGLIFLLFSFSKEKNDNIVIPKNVYEGDRDRQTDITRRTICCWIFTMIHEGSGLISDSGHLSKVFFSELSSEQKIYKTVQPLAT